MLTTLWVAFLCPGCDSEETTTPPTVLAAPSDDSAPPYVLEARQNAFRLYYRERLLRIYTAFNRFALAGDVVAATSFGKLALARRGNVFEVVPGPNDNNPIGFAAFVTYQAYKAFRGRELELTLIRLFEGLSFLEAVTDHEGLTVREALPGWTRTVDGLTGEIIRTRGGVSVIAPVESPASLEQEILRTFYKGVVFVYREDPGEYTFNLKPVQELEYYALTGVFSEPGRFLRISDCCSSWMITPRGPWEGAYWGNHNSRDNFPDLSFGYLAAMQCARDPSAPEDLRLAAQRAEEAGWRVGDRIFTSGGALMTVAESRSYDELTPSGQLPPCWEPEWQDLGSMATCQMDYLARAISSPGLDLPLPELPLPGALEKMFLQDLLHKLGCDIPLPDLTCTDMDTGLIGLGWGEILDLQLFGMPWYEFLKKLGEGDPDLLPGLFGSMMDDFYELQLAQAATCYYARIFEKPDLYEHGRRTLSNLIEMQRVFAYLLEQPAVKSGLREGVASPATKADAAEMLYAAAVFSRLFGLAAPDEDLQGFSFAESRNVDVEGRLEMIDTAPEALLSQDEIDHRIQKACNGSKPWIQDRYRQRFGDSSPVRRTDTGYEALIGLEPEIWAPVETPRHNWFGAHKFLFEMPLCTFDPGTLDCTWAAVGCVRADLNGDGTADGRDATLFDAAWADYGPDSALAGARCGEANGWCGGGDLTRGGRLNEEDREFFQASLGCSTGAEP